MGLGGLPTAEERRWGAYAGRGGSLRSLAVPRPGLAFPPHGRGCGGEGCRLSPTSGRSQSPFSVVAVSEVGASPGEGARCPAASSRRPLAEALRWCRHSPVWAAPAAARSAAETWGKFLSDLVSTGGGFAAGRRLRPAWGGCGAASLSPAPAGRGLSPLGLRLPPAQLLRGGGGGSLKNPRPPAPRSRSVPRERRSLLRGRAAASVPSPLRERGRLACPARVGSGAPDTGCGSGSQVWLWPRTRGMDD